MVILIALVLSGLKDTNSGASSGSWWFRALVVLVVVLHWWCDTGPTLVQSKAGVTIILNRGRLVVVLHSAPRNTGQVDKVHLRPVPPD